MSVETAADPHVGAAGNATVTRLTTTEGGPADRAVKIAVVIPCYKVQEFILDVVRRIGPECWRIYAIDDCCPVESGAFLARNCTDPRLRVIRHETNQGVGGAVMTGYKAAIRDGATIIVKVDGDGQMPPELLPNFVAPIVAGEADYAKGNRFYDLTHIGRMPRKRIFGNAALSFLSKLSGGYWDIFDPTNGYTAIHAVVAADLPFDLISRRYFFETDMLFRLNTMRAVVVDVPLDAIYGEEVSNLKISRIFGEFLLKHARNCAKRLFYNYFLRDMSVASMELVAGLGLMAFGITFGGYRWVANLRSSVPTPTGTVMLAALPIILGLQFLLAFLSYDISFTPKRPIHQFLARRLAAIDRCGASK